MFKYRGRPSIDPSATDTLIGEGSYLEGFLKSKATIRIEGQLKGDIECEGDVIIGENGEVFSNIRARNLVVAGKLTGDTLVTEQLKITSKGQIHGNIQCKTIVIEEGGAFFGSSEMNSSGKEAAITEACEDTAFTSSSDKHAAGL